MLGEGVEMRPRIRRPLLAFLVVGAVEGMIAHLNVGSGLESECYEAEDLGWSLAVVVRRCKG